ncbi:lipopolysaccharide heptosyltransferase II [Dasania sp. GY-MA-18]|uniref:lipopolysaccharide heptosyltransferase II n=1 Tax=Dasania phycosphaerae TaxID=2950436 RepID=A0A9J6RJJ3_9GAMM|nr:MULTISPECIES: lipopolysaccharide heptosyltransferase II [Dasania]MCR8922109.1 lipopolysaccharide heptosyltransferase II [Dasania sp. GY-MA-18]MCZ0864537.1 lipopolysaccharide heptosyltransferase II [Dasania phycosphaerae]MCZ0868265.1 lipopolysaccharide heptosyltransferase II [Dasania phycosphaerae]
MAADRDVKKILIVGPSWVGDMVMAQALFIALKQKHPSCIIDVLAPEWSLPILERMPEVRAGIVMPVGHGKLDLSLRQRLGQQLAREHYQQAILLPNSFKSALVPFFAEIPERTGWRGEMRYFLLNDIRLLNKKRYPLMVQRFVALAYKPGAELPQHLPRPSLQVDEANAQAVVAKFGLADKPFLALCPGAEFGPAKRWPEQHYAAVAQQFIQRGWRVALFGSANDVAVAETIQGLLSAEARQHCISVAGQTSLAEAVDLLAKASAVVSNDSGLMHIAAALARPMVVVYGSTSPGFTPPLSDNVRVEQLAVDCGPCFKRECPLGHLKCLQDLAASRVINSLDQLLRSNES